MKKLEILTSEEQWKAGETAIAFGMFDGVHLGHQKLMHTAVDAAKQRGIKSLIYTFSNHPLEIIAPERIPDQIETEEEKIESIRQSGADAALLRPFDQRYASLDRETYVRFIVEHLNPRVFVIGFNYTFGAKGQGKAEDLKRIGLQYGVETIVVDEVELGGETVSSTRIRLALQDGNVHLAGQLLGRAYRIKGCVESGKHLGRIFGFPTANVQVPPKKVLPKFGVYACYAFVEGSRYIAAVNVGVHPTAPEGTVTIEAFLQDYDGKPLYGKEMTLEFCAFIRPERKFDSMELLKEEVERNCQQVKQILHG